MAMLTCVDNQTYANEFLRFDVGTFATMVLLFRNCVKISNFTWIEHLHEQISIK